MTKLQSVCLSLPSADLSDLDISSEEDFENTDYSSKDEYIEDKNKKSFKTRSSSSAWKAGYLNNKETQFKLYEPSYVSFVPESELPIDFFRKFFKDEIIKVITDSTNEYSVEKNGYSLNVSVDEMEQ